MKISNPFGLKGYLEVEGSYKVGSKSGKLSPTSSGNADVSVPIPWKPNEPFEIQLSMQVEYELLKIGGVDFWDIHMAYTGSGEFGAMAKWRANLTEDGLELQPMGSGPSGSSKSKNDIVVAIGGALTSQSFAKEKKPFTKFEAILLAGLESQGIGVGWGPVSTTLGGGAHLGSTYPMAFKIEFAVEKAPVKEEKKAAKPPVVKVLTFNVGPYEHSKTKTDAIKQSSISGYYTWADFRNAITKLPQATLDEWEKKDPQILGGKTIRITGYADTTGPMSENDIKFAKGRAEDVKKWIQTWTGVSDSFFNVKSAGEGKGGTDKKVDEKKLAKNRYVEVELSYLQ